MLMRWFEARIRTAEDGRRQSAVRIRSGKDQGPQAHVQGGIQRDAHRLYRHLPTILKAKVAVDLPRFAATTRSAERSTLVPQSDSAGGKNNANYMACCPDSKRTLLRVGGLARPTAGRAPRVRSVWLMPNSRRYVVRTAA